MNVYKFRSDFKNTHVAPVYELVYPISLTGKRLLCLSLDNKALDYFGPPTVFAEIREAGGAWLPLYEGAEYEFFRPFTGLEVRLRRRNPQTGIEIPFPPAFPAISLAGGTFEMQLVGLSLGERITIPANTPEMIYLGQYVNFSFPATSNQNPTIYSNERRQLLKVSARAGSSAVDIYDFSIQSLVMTLNAGQTWQTATSGAIAVRNPTVGASFLVEEWVYQRRQSR